MALVDFNADTAKRVGGRCSVTRRSIYLVSHSRSIFVCWARREAANLAGLVHLDLTALVGTGRSDPGACLGAEPPFRSCRDPGVSKAAHGFLSVEMRRLQKTMVKPNKPQNPKNPKNLVLPALVARLGNVGRPSCIPCARAHEPALPITKSTTSPPSRGH